MQHSYGQFCTLARAAEVLCERWTPLLVHELLCGSVRFNDLHRGVPRMSSSLLAQRLRRLEQAGVVQCIRSGKVTEYHLSAAGQQLRPIIAALAAWGGRWDRTGLRNDELDPALLMWDMRRVLARDCAWLPPARVISVYFTDAGPDESRWWLANVDGGIGLLRQAPVLPTNACITASIRALTELWRGDCSLSDALGTDAVRIGGKTDDVQGLLCWLQGLHGERAALPDSPAMPAVASVHPFFLHN